MIKIKSLSNKLWIFKSLSVVSVKVVLQLKSRTGYWERLKNYSPVLKNAIDYVFKEWQGKPAAFVSYGGTNGSRSIDQIKQVCASIGMIDSNAVIELRDIGQRNKAEIFEGNQFDNKAVNSIINKLIQYANV